MHEVVPSAVNAAVAAAISIRRIASQIPFLLFILVSPPESPLKGGPDKRGVGQ